MNSESEQPPAISQAAFAFIFFTVVLDMLALGIMVPVLPKLMIAFEAGDHARAATVTGVFGFFWALMQFVASPILGSLSDRFGRRPVLLLSSLGLGLDYVVMALAPNIEWLFVGRLVSGVTAATFSTASAYISDITPPEKRAGRFGMLGAAFGIGFIVGPAVGGLLGHIDLRLPFWISAAFSLLNTLYGFFVLPESLAAENRRPFTWKLANPISTLSLAYSDRFFLLLFSASFFASLAHESLPSMFVLYTDYRFSWDERTVGLVLGTVGVGSMLVAAGVTRPMVRRLGESKTLLFGAICGGLGFFTYAFSWNPQVFWAGIPLVSLTGVCNPSVQALLSSHFGQDRQGQMQGAISSLRGMAGMIGPILFTQSFHLATSSSPHGVVGLPVGIPYYLAAVLQLLSALAVVAYIVSGGRDAAGKPAREPQEDPVPVC